MGWTNGSEIFDGIINVLSNKLDDDDLRSAIYRELIPIFEEFDCDALEECIGVDPVFDIVIKEIGARDDDYYEADDWDVDE